jgi:RHH-type proline utilization regulon transcriptional repressor/proline dehydrogenase/delta 1-pyrroline-5-carboxylate dehydrogenase
VGGQACGDEERSIGNPARPGKPVGRVREADDRAVERALTGAAAAATAWGGSAATLRADMLRRAADLLELHTVELVARVVREGGRCLSDALDEVREAVDFCRYYAWRAELDFAHPRVMPGPVGEHNELQLHGRGVFACISPWNFPLAIFTGQVAAALAAGNTVLAKPARQTPLTAALVVDLLHQAGTPVEVLHLLPGSGSRVGQQLFADPRLSGVAFTGSTETARIIQRALAQRAGPIVPLVAETGGQNVMIADSSALPEQLVMDVLRSAFNSAGQRCSALRVLFVQADIADRVIALLRGAMEELEIGDPLCPCTDVGPLIDASAVATLRAHAERMEHAGRLIHTLRLPPALAGGCFFPPQVYELTTLEALDAEVFGPVLHLIRYSAGQLDKVIDAVNATGYGLTLGVHSRIEATWLRVRERARVGNLYVNRDMIGAVVGVQPFGGEGLSGTGPKAGGPYYLYRFATERTRSINTAALGGDTALLSLADD